MNLDTRLLHRLKQARKAAGVSQRSISRRSGIPIRDVREQEESNDIRLSVLFRWKKALNVPLKELIAEAPDEVDETVRIRAGLIQLMRSIRSLCESELSDSQHAITQNMETELRAMMPELSHVSAWPQYGNRRCSDDPARIESQIVATAIWFPELGNEI